MRLLAALVLAAAPMPALAAPSARQAQADPAVTVRGPERMICRAQVRTSTRMRTSRVCRSISEWRAQEDSVQAGSYDNIDDAAFRAMGVFERNVEWDGNGGHTGPLGPR